MYLGPGWRAKIGHLYPSGGQADYEVQRMAPEGVQFLTTRLPFARTGVADDRALIADLEAHARLVADAAVDLIALNCTAASAIAGPAVLAGRIHAATGVTGTSTFEAVLAALRAAGLRRIALLTAYGEEVNATEASILQGEGFEVVAIGGIPCTTPVEQGAIPPGAVAGGSHDPDIGPHRWPAGELRRHPDLAGAWSDRAGDQPTGDRQQSGARLALPAPARDRGANRAVRRAAGARLRRPTVLNRCHAGCPGGSAKTALPISRTMSDSALTSVARWLRMIGEVGASMIAA